MELFRQYRYSNYEKQEAFKIQQKLQQAEKSCIEQVIVETCFYVQSNLR